MTTGSLSTISKKLIFDNLSYGTHFITTDDGKKFIKIKPPECFLGWNVWYQDNWGNKNKFNAVNYNGQPETIAFDESVAEYDERGLFDMDTVCNLMDKNSIREEDERFIKGVMDAGLDIQSVLTTPKIEPLIKCSTLMCGGIADWEIVEENSIYESLYKCNTCYIRNSWKNGTPLNQNKKSIDSPVKSDSLIESSDIVSENNLENKQSIKPINKMQTYNTLKEAVIAAINELKAAGNLSAYQITQLIRSKVNASEWAVTDCLASQPNNANITYWINHGDVRRIVNEMYSNNELDSLGFTGRSYNGDYQVYSFDNSNANALSQGVVLTPSNSTFTPTIATPLSDLTLRVDAYLKRHIDDVESPTLKKIQSALKTVGITCEQFAQIVNSLNYNVVPETIGNYSTYYVTAK